MQRGSDINKTFKHLDLSATATKLFLMICQLMNINLCTYKVYLPHVS